MVPSTEVGTTSTSDIVSHRPLLGESRSNDGLDGETKQHAQPTPHPNNNYFNKNNGIKNEATALNNYVSG